MVRGDLVSGTLTLLVSDIEESAIRWEMRQAAMRDAVYAYKALLRECVERHGGTVYKEGPDGLSAAFQDAGSAVAAALDAQAAVRERDWKAIDGLMARIAVHSGPAEWSDEDYVGPTARCMSRLLGAAHGGQIVLSRQTAELAEIPPATLRDRFPLLQSIEAHPTNLSPHQTSFVDRRSEIATIERMIGDRRLVTLTGHQGVGKSRLAMRAASAALEAFPDGVWLVDLETVGEPKLLPGAIASVCGIEQSGGSRSLLERVALAFKNKAALIVLDGCDRLASAAGEAAERILQQCPNVRVLATSSKPLNTVSERIFEVPALLVPPNAEGGAAEAMAYPAVALFVERARSNRKPLVLEDRDVPAVTSVVQRLGGNALAIELVASQVQALNVELVAERLPERPDLPAIIAWSCALLGAAEHGVFYRLGIFRGAFSLDAATAVCIGEPSARWLMQALLSSLVDASLLVAELEESKPRYRMSESTRAAALAELKESADFAATARRHCAYYCMRSEEAFAQFWHVNLETWHAQLRPDLDNYRAAIEWSLGGRHDVEMGARIVANLSESQLFEIRDLTDRALTMLPHGGSGETRGRLLLARVRKMTGSAETQALASMASEAATIFEKCGDTVHQVEALVALGSALYRMGKFEQTVPVGDRALALAHSVDLPRLGAHVLNQSGLWYAMTGDTDRGLAIYTEAIELLRSQNDYRRLNIPLCNVAELLFLRGMVAEALEHVYEAVALEREMGNESAILISQLNIVAYLMALDRSPEAWSNARACLEMADRLEETLPSAMAIGHLAQIASRVGDYERSARLLGYVDAVYAARSLIREPTEKRGYEETMSALREGISRQRLETLLAEGAKTEQATAVDAAMSVQYLML